MKKLLLSFLISLGLLFSFSATYATEAEDEAFAICSKHWNVELCHALIYGFDIKE
jgi:hypothetical protein